MTARAVLVAPCPLTGPPVLHLPGRTGWTRCGKPVTDEWATTTATPDDPRHCRPCTRSAAMTARCDHGSIAEAVRRGDTR